MYKLIACDLDETLLSSDSTVCQRNRDAIAKARKQGVHFVLATGRPYNSAHNTLRELDLYDAPDEYMISFNGGILTENKDEKILSYTGLDFETASVLFERAKPYDVCVHVYTPDTVWGWRIHDGEREYVRNKMKITEFDGDSIDFLKDQPIVKMLYVNTDRSYLQSIACDLQDITGNLDVSYSSNRYLEFNPKGVTKGSGLLKLAEMLHIDPSETMAIGDNYNDLSMILDAGLGVGVANTVDSMKDLCQYITDATHNEGGVGEAIEKFVLS